MRIIKFRVWNEAGRKFEEDLEKFKIRYNILDNFGDGQNFIAEQFTGIKDRGGQEIYEGDFISFINPEADPFPTTVVWNKKSLQFQFQENFYYENKFCDYLQNGDIVDDEWYDEKTDRVMNIKIVGNIHLNTLSMRSGKIEKKI